MMKKITNINIKTIKLFYQTTYDLEIKKTSFILIITTFIPFFLYFSRMRGNRSLRTKEELIGHRILRPNASK